MVDSNDRSGAKFLIGLIALLAVMGIALWLGVAHAQTARSATITFTRPTQYTDGTTIPTGTAITYNVYQGARGSTTKTRVGTITATATTINSGLQPGETCWQVATVANGVESTLSNEGCKTFPWPATESVTITVT